jgi:hypothetical protein
MRGLLSIGILALLPVAALAQWHGASAARPAPRAPVVPAFMARPAPLHTPNPRGGGLPFRPGAPGVTLVRPNGHGGFHGGHIGPNFGFGVGRFPFGVPPQNRCFSDAFFDPFYCTRRPVGRGGFGALGFFGAYPYYSLPVIWDSGQDYAEMAAQQMAEQTAQASSQVSDLTSQLEQLREELRQLREQPSAPPAPAPAQKEAPPVPTTLIFRDGRRSEVTNYAIVGGTLWIFNDQRARKVPIASLDIPATQQANEDRGVDFVVPASGK